MYESGACVTVALCMMRFFFKQKTAYEMRISDWSSDVCSSDLMSTGLGQGLPAMEIARPLHQTLLNCQLQTDLATGRISHGRVATMQSTFEQTVHLLHFQRHLNSVHTMHVEYNTLGIVMNVQQPEPQKAPFSLDLFSTVHTDTRTPHF